MKIGFRAPSISKSISAKTTGRLTRSVKSTINPLYGKKGMGVINDPKRAVKNAVYNRTTVGIQDLNRTINANHSNGNVVSSASSGTYQGTHSYTDRLEDAKRNPMKYVSTWDKIIFGLQTIALAFVALLIIAALFFAGYLIYKILK